jgi:hypothetical protein
VCNAKTRQSERDQRVAIDRRGFYRASFHTHSRSSKGKVAFIRRRLVRARRCAMPFCSGPVAVWRHVDRPAASHPSAREISCARSITVALQKIVAIGKSI